MARLCLPDGAVRGIDIQGARTGATARYSAGRDGTVTVDNPLHEKALRDMGAFPANLGGAAGDGFICPCCSFRSFFRRCSRCGGQCERASDASSEEDRASGA